MLKTKKSKILIGVIGAIIVSALVGFLIVRASPDSVSDTFTDETYIGKGTSRVEIATTTGQVKIAACYSPNPSWTKIADTIVRDISNLSNALATTSKDIYCDDYNCILITDGVAPSIAVCIATDSNVYANLLWAKADSASKTWGPAGWIAGYDIGDTHPSDFKAGKDNTAIGAKSWLERYYESSTGTYPAMDECKAKGSGWRLPNLLELDSIRDQAKGAAPYSRLPGIASAPYWSSSESSDTYAYGLAFHLGGVASYSKTDSYRVRCVRGW